MASNGGELTITVRVDPQLARILSALNAAREVAELVPDWHDAERRKLLKHIRRGRKTLAELMQ